MEEEERRALRNVRIGIDTYEEESSLTIELESGISGRVKEVKEICQGIESVKSVRKNNTLLWEEDGDIRKRLTTEDRKRKISQEPVSLLSQHGDNTNNLKTGMKPEILVCLCEGLMTMVLGE